jgi:hypothetical protein
MIKKHQTVARIFMLFAFLLPGGVLYARRNEILCEIKFAGATGVERDAGVWVDGVYVGYVRELKGTRKVLLLPGEHVITFRQNGYTDVTKKIVLGPGQKENMFVAMDPDPRAQYPTLTAAVKVSVWPNRAAVFVDDQFVGHAAEFDGIGRKMLLSPGKHRFRITLPAWHPFETEVTLLPNQEFHLKTSLIPGDIRQDKAPMKEQLTGREKSALLPAVKPTS